MTFENMSENQRRDFWTGYKELLTPLREKGDQNMIRQEEQKRINVYMDLVAAKERNT